MIKRLGRKLLPALLAVACLGGVAASSASATGEYWMYENYAGPGARVSSPPHYGIYFIGLYTAANNWDTIWLSSDVWGGYKYYKYGSGSLTESFPAYNETARGVMENNDSYTAKYTAETRF